MWIIFYIIITCAVDLPLRDVSRARKRLDQFKEMLVKRRRTKSDKIVRPNGHAIHTLDALCPICY